MSSSFIRFLSARSHGRRGTAAAVKLAICPSENAAVDQVAHQARERLSCVRDCPCDAHSHHQRHQRQRTKYPPSRAIEQSVAEPCSFPLDTGTEQESEDGADERADKQVHNKTHRSRWETRHLSNHWQHTHHAHHRAENNPPSQTSDNSVRHVS